MKSSLQFFCRKLQVEFLTSGRRDVKFGYTKFADFFDNDRQTFNQLSATFRQFKNWPNWIVSTSVGDYHDDENMWVKVERNQYGRSFTRSLQGTNCCIEKQRYWGWILRKGGNLGLVQLICSIVVIILTLAQLLPFFYCS